MELRKVLEEQKGNRILYVGAASSFLVAGKKDEILKKLPKVDKKKKKKVDTKKADILTQYRIAQRQLGKKHDTVKMLHQRYIEVADPIPLLDREVISTFERISEDALNIIVTGEETGTIWSVTEQEPLELKYNIEDLVGAILREVVREYKLSLRNELKTYAELLDRLESYRKESKEFEDYLNSKDAKRFLIVDTEYVIKKAREGIAETLAEKKKP